VLCSHTNGRELSLLPLQAPGASTRRDKSGNRLFAALQNLHRLLEDHAPQWYTYEHHRKSELGLRREGREQAEAFLMLYDLLEEYAPRWYPRELRKRTKRTVKHLKDVQRSPAQKAGAYRAHPRKR
jgi:hypothetical protein